MICAQTTDVKQYKCIYCMSPFAKSASRKDRFVQSRFQCGMPAKAWLLLGTQRGCPRQISGPQSLPCNQKHRFVKSPRIDVVRQIQRAPARARVCVCVCATGRRCRENSLITTIKKQKFRPHLKWLDFSSNFLCFSIHKLNRAKCSNRFENRQVGFTHKT